MTAAQRIRNRSMFTPRTLIQSRRPLLRERNRYKTVVSARYDQVLQLPSGLTRQGSSFLSMQQTFLIPGPVALFNRQMQKIVAQDLSVTLREQMRKKEAWLDFGCSEEGGHTKNSGTHLV